MSDMNDRTETDRSFDELTGGRVGAPSPATGTVADPTARLERPDFWDEGMERELHEAVSDAFQAIVDEKQ